MQILPAELIRRWDQFTISHEPITSIDLMERAAGKCFDWLKLHHYLSKAFDVYCGKGNNGGDGLAIARMLDDAGCRVNVHIIESGQKGSPDFQANLERLHKTSVEITFIQPALPLRPIAEGNIIIDAIFGAGLNRAPEEFTSGVITHLNQSAREIISIDIPSGMYCDAASSGNTIVKATHTLSFQCFKKAFLLPSNEAFCGTLHILDIGLSPSFLNGLAIIEEFIDEGLVKALYHPRKSFAHKGNYGHALIAGGSYGKMGAVVLASRSCLRAGAGLVSCLVPACGYTILQTAVPEAMVITDAGQQQITTASLPLGAYNAIGLGPGIGTAPSTVKAVEQILSGAGRPMVIDADALNILSAHHHLLKLVPPFSILTPHPKEFERLFGKTPDDFARLELAAAKSKEHQVIIVLKGHYTFVAMPGGKRYFNTTGNAGMATGGSGDVLTGILTSLLGQGYFPQEAALMGVYIHGAAGDIMASKKSQEAMIASDISEGLGEVFLSLAR